MPKIKIKNLNTEINRRIKLIKTATSVVDIGQQQGAVVNQSDYVGICLSPAQNIPIGCAGATPTADTGGIWGNVTMTVNGIPHETVMPIDGVLDVDNHGEELHNTFKNQSDQYVRVHITATELNQADHGWNENQNPTRSVNFNTGTIDFCLAPLDAPVISCEGATQSFKFALAFRDGIPSDPDIKLLLDGAEFTEPPAWLNSETLSETYTGEVPEGFSVGEGVERWANEDNQPHRLEFICNTPNDIRVIIFDNPTVVQMSDVTGQDVGVCISPNEAPNYDIRYFANGAWVNEITGPNVSLSSERNNNYKLSSTQLEIKPSVKSVGSNTFADWTSLTTLELSEGLETIWYYAFQQNQSLLKVKIPNSVTAIWDSAFHSCTSVTLLDIGENIGNIPNWCFSNLTQLNTLVFRNPTIPTLAEFAFGNGGAGSTNPQNIYAPDGSVDQYQQLLQYVFSNVNVRPLSEYQG